MAELSFRHNTTADQLGEILNDFSFAVSELNEYEKELLTWLFYKVIGVQSYNIYRDTRIKKLCLKWKNNTKSLKTH